MTQKWRMMVQVAREMLQMAMNRRGRDISTINRSNQKILIRKIIERYADTIRAEAEKRLEM